MVREIRGDDLSVEPTARQSAPPRKSLAAVELPVPFIDWEDAHSTCSGMRDDGEPEHNRSRSHYRQTKFTMAPKGDLRYPPARAPASTTPSDPYLDRCSPDSEFRTRSVPDREDGYTRPSSSPAPRRFRSTRPQSCRADHPIPGFVDQLDCAHPRRHPKRTDRQCQSGQNCDIDHTVLQRLMLGMASWARRFHEPTRPLLA